jgi:hypothetical protein
VPFTLIEVFGDPARPIEVWSRDEAGKMRLLWQGGIGAELPDDSG